MALLTKLKGTSATTALALLGAGLLTTSAFGADVALKSADGTVNLTGELIDFADGNYILKTALGQLRISASRVRCEGEDCPVFETTTADVHFVGSESMSQGLMPLLMSGYASHLDAEATITNTSVEGEVVAKLVGDGGFGEDLSSFLVSSASSADAFEALTSKSAEVAMSSRRIVPAEARALRDSGAGNMISPSQEHIAAVDSLVVITHPNNPVQSVSIENLRGIYTGAIKNWSELGGDDLEIVAFNHEDGSGTRAVFVDRVSGGEDLNFADGQQAFEGHQQVAAAVNSDPAAIGYVGFAFQRGAKSLALVNECGISTTPDAFSAKTEEYALQRRLYLYTRSDTNTPASQDFIDYVASTSADGVIAKAGFVDLGISSRKQDENSARALTLQNSDVDAFEAGVMGEMLADMINYDRLSTTFRFRTGSSTLDERGRLDMSRLADYLENLGEGASVKFVGFTDSVGAFESNRNLSVGRAKEAARQLEEFSAGRLEGVKISSAGYGEIAPSACNITESGRSVNRRVEVWIES
ncbi:MAG: phosphate ABC transporter substrate-binding/OmpA family protein [Litoreibacter sp.]